MEDHKINHHFLKLHPPSSSSTPPPEADQVAQLLGFFNLHTPTCNNHPPYSTGGMSQSSGDAINSSRMMGGKRRKTNNNNNDDNDKEVIHVRAKRGQATDRHSLAERVRRERINEKLRVLQDLVPGCYKTMGMAVMLDVIINYVRSLQNQIEFLSMKLSSASVFCDFNAPQAAEALQVGQQRENPCEAREIETVIMRDEGFGAAVDDQSPHSTWPF